MPDFVWVGAIDADCTEHLPVNVVETNTFRRCAKKLFSDGEVAEIKFRLALNPELGDTIRGGSGVRKVRWALGNRGKSHGARVIYYYHNSDVPIFLITAYAKNQKENLTDIELQKIKVLIKTLLSEYGYD